MAVQKLLNTFYAMLIICTHILIFKNKEGIKKPIRSLCLHVVHPFRQSPGTVACVLHASHPFTQPSGTQLWHQLFHCIFKLLQGFCFLFRCFMLGFHHPKICFICFNESLLYLFFYHWLKEQIN